MPAVRISNEVLTKVSSTQLTAGEWKAVVNQANALRTSPALVIRAAVLEHLKNSLNVKTPDSG